jgi:hypothetical protein
MAHMTTASTWFVRISRVCVGVLPALALSAACTDTGKVSEEQAAAHAQGLAKLAAADVQEVRRGLPRAAKSLAALWAGDADPHGARASVLRKLEQVRNGDSDLTVAKSTFFALTDDQGSVLCSDQDPDSLRDKTLLTAFPELRKVLGGETVETVGSMPEIAAKSSVVDQQWLSGTPVLDPANNVRGMYVTGWSYKRFAYHLEETLKHDITVEAIRAKKERFKQPLLYVFVFAGQKVYGTPVSPQVNADALEKLDLPSKTAAGLHRQQVEITHRTFGLAAARVAELGPNAGVAVLRSEI